MNAPSPDAIQAETVSFTGHGGDEIEAYRAMPLAHGLRGSVVWIHHMPGYDRQTKEFVRRLAVSGYHTVAPNLYSREAPGAAPDDAAAASRAAGGVPDERLVGDVAGAVEYLRSLPGANGYSFFSVDRPAYRPEAAVDGWRRIDAFFATHLKG
ncbi:MAG: hypothetical protein EKK34_30765 [Mycobacterium sp.]|nr:MAG: hypothetical protein EKK34_30765 [Mycobacterium sp.]